METTKNGNNSAPTSLCNDTTVSSDDRELGSTPAPLSLSAPVSLEDEPNPFESLQDLAPTCISTTNSQAPMPLVPVTQNDVAIVRLLTTEFLPVEIHYLQSDEMRGYVQCNGSVCALCLSGNKKSLHRLLLVLDIINQEISLLRIPGGKGAGALLPQIVPLLERLESEKTSSTLVQIQRNGTRFHVVHLGESAGLDLGDSIIAGFNARMKPMTRAQQAEYFRSSIEYRTNKQLIDDVPKVATVIRARNPGIDLKSL